MRNKQKIGVCLLFACGLNAGEPSGSLSTSSEQVPTVSTTTPLISPGLKLNINNSLGVGSFLAREESSGQFSSLLTLNGSLTFNKIYSDKNLKIAVDQKANFSWIEPPSASGTKAPSVSLTDLIVRASIKEGIFKTDAGLSLTPSLEAEAPVSESSRKAKRYVGLGGALSLAWSKFGITVSYKPLLTGFINGTLSSSDRSTRQTNVLLKNTLSADYKNGNHKIGVTFRLYDAFLEPLPQNGLYASTLKPDSDLKENTLGIIEYNYTVPTSFPLELNLGLSSYQPSRNASGTFNFPFFDFVTPVNNYTQFYFEMELGIL